MGRGQSKSGGGGGGGAGGMPYGGGTPDGRELANELYQNRSKQQFDQIWSWAKETIKDQREYEKTMPEQTHTYYFDGRPQPTVDFEQWERNQPLRDVSIWMIYGDGSQSIINEGDNVSSFSLRKKPAYVRISHSEGFDDSLGGTANDFIPRRFLENPNDKNSAIKDKINFEYNQGSQERYDTRIEQLFKTEWGRRHPNDE